MSRIHRFLIAILILIFATGQADAGLFRHGDTITIEREQELQENLTAVGTTVHMSGVIHGDLITSANAVFVDGYVDGQLLAAARTVSIHGGFGGDGLVFAQEITVSDGGFEDFRGAAQRILLNIPIRGDVFLAGQYITLGSDATVAGDVAVAGESLTVNGDIQGKLTGAGESIRIGALVDGDAVLYTDDLLFAEGSSIRGNLTLHYRDQVPEIPEDAVFGKITLVQEEQKGCGSCWWTKLWFILASIVTGWLLLLVSRRCISQDLDWALALPLPSLGFGFLTFAVIPVAVVVSAILILTIPVSLMLLILYGPLLYVAWIFGGWLAGIMILQSLTKKMPSHYLGLALGVLLISLIGMIPYIGCVIGFIVMLAGLGMITKGVLRLMRG
ncbi:MAG: polymer-forming cytoskeletal protein [bacterium]